MYALRDAVAGRVARAADIAPWVGSLGPVWLRIGDGREFLSDLFSWAADSGETGRKLRRAVLRFARDTPVHQPKVEAYLDTLRRSEVVALLRAELNNDWIGRLYGKYYGSLWRRTRWVVLLVAVAAVLGWFARSAAEPYLNTQNARTADQPLRLPTE